jgi:hypothetical protein
MSKFVSGFFGPTIPVYPVDNTIFNKSDIWQVKKFPSRLPDGGAATDFWNIHPVSDLVRLLKNRHFILPPAG